MPARQNPRSVAVVDIGSNSVRLVIFAGTKKKHHIALEKKAICGLAKGMTHKRPRLDPKGMALTLKALQKFRTVIKEQKPQRVLAIGTAALRTVAHTKRGRKFHHAAERALGHKIAVISGKKEARLTAYGVIGSLPRAAGICGDLGGGSLELASISRNRVGHTTTLSLGSLTLISETRGNIRKAENLMHERLRHIDWLTKAKGKTFYPIGGSWRAVARVLMKKLGKPIRRVHGFTVRPEQAYKILSIMARQKSASFRKMHKKIRHRSDTIPIAAAVLYELILRMQPAHITFSGHGVREGVVRRGI